MAYKTEQEKFWAGEFGDNYLKRNTSNQYVAYRTAVFSRILKHSKGIKTCLEIGANTGVNLIALGRVFPDIKMDAVEINEKAARICAEIPNVTVFNESVLDYEVAEEQYDLVFTSGVLIHINPEYLDTIYKIMYRGSRRYILVAEYYNPVPVEVSYRGNDDKLYKRDFAGEIMDKYPGLQLVDYGFFYHRDYNWPCDDMNWFLMEKR